jgi:hypothetical protein
VTAVPRERTWLFNDSLSSTNLNAYISDPLTFLLNKPFAQMRQSVAQNVTNATFTALTFTTEDVDDDPTGGSGHSTSSNTSRYTAIYPGWYLCAGGVVWTGNSTSRRASRWAVNGTAINGSQILLPASIAQNVSHPARTIAVYLDVGDYVELQAWQDSGGTLATIVAAAEQSHLTVSWERLTA